MPEWIVVIENKWNMWRMDLLWLKSKFPVFKLYTSSYTRVAFVEPALPNAVSFDVESKNCHT